MRAMHSFQALEPTATEDNNAQQRLLPGKSLQWEQSRSRPVGPDMLNQEASKP